MTRIKQLVDPGELFNPGVLINDDPGIVSRNIKRTPTVSPRIDKCIECGFCEHVCPSRLVTLTPRGRIQASRKHAELLASGDDIGADELWHQFQHDGINTCAADGMCGTKCPVGINVAEYTADLRSERNNKTGTSLGSLLARRYGEVERIARGGLAMGVLANRAHTMEALTTRGSQADPVLARLVAGDRQEPAARCSDPRAHPRSSTSPPVSPGSWARRTSARRRSPRRCSPSPPARASRFACPSR